MGFLSWLTGSSPGVAVGQAGAEVVKGIFESVESLIEVFHLPPAEAAQFKQKLAELQLQTLQTQLQDVQSARQMQMATKSVWPGALTAINTLGFFATIGAIIVYGMPKLEASGTEALLLLLGALVTGYTTSMAFWLGKNSGSEETKMLLYNSQPTYAVKKNDKSEPES